MTEPGGKLYLQNDEGGTSTTSESWWCAVQFISDLIVRENIDIWDENHLVAELKSAGFLQNDIEKSIGWVQDSSRTGRIQCTLGFIQERSMSRFRIENPAESAFLSVDLWRKLETLRMKGIISIGMMEKLLVSLRSLDSRDWEDDEIQDFIDNVLMKNAESYSVAFDEYSEAEDHYRPFC